MISALEWSIILLSLKVSLVAVILTMPVAYALAWLLARLEFPGRSLLDALVHLPLVVPPVVVGWGLLMLFGIQGPIGAPLHAWFGIRLVFTTEGAALATAVMSFPLIVRAVRLGLEQVDPEGKIFILHGVPKPINTNQAIRIAERKRVLGRIGNLDRERIIDLLVYLLPNGIRGIDFGNLEHLWGVGFGIADLALAEIGDVKIKFIDHPFHEQ
jgi:ABC-type spermidine/putrescine transport system permease subunit I